jgi:predicted CopG family antitoxin
MKGPKGNAADGRITMSVSRDIYNRITKYGKFGDSFNDVLVRILDELETKGGGKK